MQRAVLAADGFSGLPPCDPIQAQPGPYRPAQAFCLVRSLYLGQLLQVTVTFSQVTITQLGSPTVGQARFDSGGRNGTMELSHGVAQ